MNDLFVSANRSPVFAKIDQYNVRKGFSDSPDGSEGGEDGVTVASEV